MSLTFFFYRENHLHALFEIFLFIYFLLKGIYIQGNIYKIGNLKHFKMECQNKLVSKYFILMDKSK